MAQKPKTEPELGTFSKISHPKKRAFLQAFARTCSVTRSAEAAKVEMHSHYYWQKTDPEYVKAFAEAQNRGVEVLEAEAIRRANEGWEEAVYHQGKVVGKRRVYDSTLLIFLLKGAKPEKYRERYEHSGPGGAQLEIIVTQAGHKRDKVPE